MFSQAQSQASGNANFLPDSLSPIMRKTLCSVFFTLLIQSVSAAQINNNQFRSVSLLSS